MRPLSTLRSYLFLAGSSLFAISYLPAATFYWDNNGTILGFGNAGGNWAQNSTSGGTTARWKTDATGVIAGSATQVTANSDIFHFGTASLGLGSGTINVNAAGVTMGDTFYGAASGAVVLSGGTINFGVAKTITVNNASNTINSIIGGAATSLTKAGSGTLALTETNTYTGTTIINGGALDLGGGTANGSLASTALTLGGGTLNYTRTGSSTQSFTTTNVNAGAAQVSAVSGNILNLGTVTRAAGGFLDFGSVGAGTVAALAANNDATGIMAGFTHGNSWAVANGDGVAISPLGSYTLSSTAGTTAANYVNNIDVDNSPGALDAPIAANSLRFSSAASNTLTLTDTTNTLTSGGILVSSAVGANLSTITGGTLGGAASKDLSIIQNNISGGLSISSVIGDNTGATALTKSGAGVLTLANSNTFTGGVFLHGGQLALDNTGALNSTAGSENAVTFGSGSSGTLALNGNSVVIHSLASNATAPGSSLVENASATPVTLTIGNSANASGTFAGIIQDGTGGGALALSKAGTGTLGLAGANTYTGNTTLTAGTVAISNSTSFGAGNVLITGASKITSAGGLTYANAINVGAALTLQIPNATPGTATFSGQLTGSSDITVQATLVNGVTGTHAFTHTNNTFTGSILMPIGSTGTGSGNDFVSFSSIGDGGTFTFRKRGHTNSIIHDGASAISFSTRQIAVSGDFGGVYDGGGVNPVNSFRNNSTDPAHTVTFNTNLTPGSIFQAGTFFFGGSNTGDNTFAGIISNASNFNLGIGKADAGRWLLTGANTYLGNVLITNGTLSVNAMDDAANAQPLGQGPFIQLGNSGTSGTLEFSGASNSSTDKQVLLGNPTNNNQAGAGGIVNNSATATLTFSNATFNSNTGTTVTTVDRTLTLGGSNTGANTISGTIQDHVASAAQILVTKTGTGTWVLSGSNTYTGATAINTGVLQAIDGTGLPTTSILQLRGGVFQSSGTFSRAVSTAAGAVNWGTGSGGFAAKGAPLVLNLNGGTASLTWNGNSMVPDGQTLIFGSSSADNLVDFQNPLNLGSGTVQTRTITVDDNPDSTADIARISGAITNTTEGMNLIKNGNGTLELTGLNSYTGTTAVDAGTLFITGATQGTSAITFGGGKLGLDIGTPVTAANATIDFTGQTVLVTGNPTLASYSLLTASSITGTPALASPAPAGYELQVFNDNELRLVAAGGTSYASWIATFPGVGILDGVNDDPDNDGIDNGMEMVLGGNPATGMDTALLPTIEMVTDPVSVPAIPAGGYLLFTYRRSDLSVAAGVTADCETDTDLVGPWTAATGAPGVVIQVDDNFTFTPPAAADTDRVRVYVPRGANTKLFGRLSVVVP